MKRLTRFFAMVLMLTLAACASTSGGKNVQDETLSAYGTAIRWSEFDAAWSHVDPALRLKQPLTELELARFKQIQVTGYEVKSRDIAPDGAILQTVEIRLINKNTQLERIVTDHQSWWWDEPNGVLWLTSGLPDFTAN
jgi:hypothetical protein